MTAEFAMVLPALALVLALGVAAAQCGVLQVQLADAAADAARMIGRGEPPGSAAARIGSAGAGASMTVSRSGPLVCVMASAPAFADGLGATFELTAEGCALDDASTGGPP